MLQKEVFASYFVQLEVSRIPLLIKDKSSIQILDIAMRVKDHYALMQQKVAVSAATAKKFEDFFNALLAELPQQVRINFLKDDGNQ